MSLAPLQLLFEDDFFVAVNKPPALLVHRTNLSEDRVFALQILRDQLGGQRVFPAHRLDRATSGALIFGKTSEAASRLGHLFMQAGSVEKRYFAIVRGHFSTKKGQIDEPLSDAETGVHVPQPASTAYEVLQQTELDEPMGGRYAMARFSLVEARPLTGRRHQIRKHFAHQSRPIVNDLKHGDNKIKRFFKEKWALERMLLHAEQLSFQHPFSNEKLAVQAPMDDEFLRAMKILSFDVSSAK